MIHTTLYSLAEKAKDRLGKGDIQTLVSAVVDALGTAVKNDYFQNKNDGINEVNGQFLYTFGEKNPIIPVYNSTRQLFEIEIPSSYLALPYDIGLTVSDLSGCTFTRDSASTYKDSLKTKAGTNGGHQNFFVEGARMFFPKMKESENILLVMSVAYTTINVREQINLSPQIIDVVIDMVVQKYSTKEKEIQDNIKA